jgi:hypothetical protein
MYLWLVHSRNDVSNQSHALKARIKIKTSETTAFLTLINRNESAMISHQMIFVSFILYYKR